MERNRQKAGDNRALSVGFFHNQDNQAVRDRKMGKVKALFELSEPKERVTIIIWDNRVTGCVDLIPKEWG